MVGRTDTATVVGGGVHVCVRAYVRACVMCRAGTNTPSDEYDSYREYRVVNTNMYSRIQ